MNPSYLLSQLQRRRITLTVDRNDLIVNAPKGALSEELRSQLKKHKTELIDYLKMIAMRDYCGVCKARLIKLPGGQWECPTEMCAINRLEATSYIN